MGNQFQLLRLEGKVAMSFSSLHLCLHVSVTYGFNCCLMCFHCFILSAMLPVCCPYLGSFPNYRGFWMVLVYVFYNFIFARIF